MFDSILRKPASSVGYRTIHRGCICYGLTIENQRLNKQKEQSADRCIDARLEMLVLSFKLLKAYISAIKKRGRSPVFLCCLNDIAVISLGSILIISCYQPLSL